MVVQPDTISTANPNSIPPERLESFIGGKLNDPTSKTKFFVNCRGLNFTPMLEEEWKKSGYLPRYADSVFQSFGFPTGTGSDPSNVFNGSNKTSIWWYYSHNDCDKQLGYMRSIGINVIRVFTDIWVWRRDPDRFINGFKDFLKICDKYKIRAMIVLWDGINV